MCPFMWDPSVRGLLVAERTAAMTGSSARQDLLPGERLARVWHIGAEMPFPGSQQPPHRYKTRRGDELTSQAEYAGSIPSSAPLLPAETRHVARPYGSAVP
jgi:hypothetical protein